MVRGRLCLDQLNDANECILDAERALRAENAKKNTQARVAMLLGVSRECVSKWFTPPKKAGNDGTSTNTSATLAGTAPPPDARVKVDPVHKPVIAAWWRPGKSTYGWQGNRRRPWQPQHHQEPIVHTPRRQGEGEPRSQDGNPRSR